MKREIALDTETTGLSPSDGHKLVEIGCVEIIDGIITGNTYHVYINPHRNMPSGAFNVHGLSEAFLADKKSFSEIADEFLDFIKKDKLIIHNAKFDMSFLNYELKSSGRKIIPKQQVFCTLLEARNKFPGSPANLNALCKKFNIDISARTKHGALLDAELLSDMYIELMGGNQSSMSFKSSNVEKKSKREIVKILEPRKHEPSKEEIKLHNEFMKKIV